MHISYESGILENPATEPPSGIYQMTVDPEKTAEVKDEIVISFKEGTICLVVSVTSLAALCLGIIFRH